MAHETIGRPVQFMPEGSGDLGFCLGIDESEVGVISPHVMIAGTNFRLLNRGRAIWGAVWLTDDTTPVNDSTVPVLKAGITPVAAADFGELVIFEADGADLVGVVISQPGTPLRVAVPLNIINGRVIWGSEFSTDSVHALTEWAQS